eukprot:6486274-Karenia_brevis.AAC.1
MDGQWQCGAPMFDVMPREELGQMMTQPEATIEPPKKWLLGGQVGPKLAQVGPKLAQVGLKMAKKAVF